MDRAIDINKRGKNMREIYETLSGQERRVLYYKSLNLSQKEIANEMGVSTRYISSLTRRIKTKALKMNINISEILPPSMANEILECFEEDCNKAIPKKTIRQAQFLQEKSTHMINTNETAAERRMRNRMGMRKKKDAYIFTRKCTEEEMASFTKQENQQPPLHIMRLKREYDYTLATESHKTEELATMEVILRSYGVILHTPHVNKLNSKTGACLRADTVVVVKDGENIDFLEPKFIEKTKNEDGDTERVYVIQGKLPRLKKVDHER